MTDHQTIKLLTFYLCRVNAFLLFVVLLGRILFLRREYGQLYDDLLRGFEVGRVSPCQQKC